MPARDISAIAEDMIDTLLEENFDVDEVYDTVEDALSLYLTPMQERVLGDVTDDAIEAAADEAANLVVSRIRSQREMPLIGGDMVNEVTVPEEPRVPPPTRFERDEVI